jgi:hypothetical protein
MSNELDFFKKLEDVLKKAPENRHSYYQLKYFVIGKEPTIQAKMWQCLKELQSRKESITNLMSDIDDLQDDFELINIEIEKENISKSKTFKDKYVKEIAVKESDIKIRKLHRRAIRINENITKFKQKIEYLIQEARFFLQAFEALEKIEPVKDYDDYDAQNQLWEAKISEEINLRLLLKQGLNSEIVKTALSLPEDSTVKVEVDKMVKGLANAKLINKEMDADKKSISRR